MNNVNHGVDQWRARWGLQMQIARSCISRASAPLWRLRIDISRNMSRSFSIVSGRHGFSFRSLGIGFSCLSFCFISLIYSLCCIFHLQLEKRIWKHCVVVLQFVGSIIRRVLGLVFPWLFGLLDTPCSSDDNDRDVIILWELWYILLDAQHL